MLAVWLLCGPSLAASAPHPEIAVVGLHVPGRMGQLPWEDADKLAKALDDTGKVDALTPEEMGKRLAGRESLIVDNYALGPGRERLKEGSVLYDRAQPDQAIPVLEQSAKLLSNGLAASTDVRDLHQALTMLGMACVGNGDDAAARAAFRRSAVLDPSRQLNAVNYPPQVLDLFEQVRREVTQVSPGHLAVTASADATVYVDGKEIGPAPRNDIPLVAGEHFVLVRGAGGASHFESLTMRPGEHRALDAALEPGGFGTPGPDNATRSRQTRDLYVSVGHYTDRSAILLAGVTPNGQVALQLYSPSSGTFSKVLTQDAGDDPVGALVDLAPAAVGFLTETGDIRPDKVSSQVVALDVSSNGVLSKLLYDPEPVVATAPPQKAGVKWYVWAGVGALAAGGGAAAAILAANAGDETPDTGDHGRIVIDTSGAAP